MNDILKKFEEINNPYLIEGLSNETMFHVLSDSLEEMAIYITDMTTSETVWSDNAVTYFGLPEDYQNRFEEVWHSHIHPDDLEGYKRDIEQIFKGEKQTHSYRYRARNRYGKYIWLRCEGCVKLDPVSKKKFFMGYIIRLDHIGLYDNVTGCLNLKEFYHQAFTDPQVFILIGMDSFRKIINHIGFTESNVILRTLGTVLQRRVDKERVYRMAGDGFLVVLDNLSVEELNYIHGEVQEEFKNEVAKIYPGLRVNYSAAGTYYDPDTDTKEKVIHRLEHTLDYSKQCGGGRFTMYSYSIEEKHARTSKIQEALTKSIANNFEGFRLVYQPIIKTATHTLDGAEALLRFYHHELGIISPTEFIPLLEASGEINQVGMWVAEEAIRQKLAWDRLHPGIHLGFNTSLIQYQDDKLSNRIAELVDQYQINHTELVVEITESQKMQDPERIRKMLQPLVDRKIRIYLDDFGMEASTFTLVQELPISGVKVDHSFVRTMVGSGSIRRDQANIAIVSSICHMAKLLEISVVVEGVENKQIDELLTQMDMPYMQGYYFSRPIGVAEFEQKWLQQPS